MPSRPRIEKLIEFLRQEGPARMSGKTHLQAGNGARFRVNQIWVSRYANDHRIIRKQTLSSIHKIPVWWYFAPEENQGHEAS